MLFNHLILCCLLLLLPSVFPSIGVFFSESVQSIRWPKYWSFSISLSPSNEYSGLIFFKINWFDLLAVQGTLKGLLHPTPQFKSVNSLALSFGTQMVQLSHPYMATGKTRGTNKVMSVLFNTLSRFVIAFLPRRKTLLISWLQLPSTVILELKKIKSAIASTSSPSICHEVMGPDAMILGFF